MGVVMKRANAADATFSARVPKSTKNILERAAELSGQTLSDFVLGTAYEKALLTIKSRELIELSARDSQAFAEALLAPTIVLYEVVARYLRLPEPTAK